MNNFSSGDVTNRQKNPGFFGRPFTKPSFQILILPLKPRGIERPEDRDKACSITTRSKSPCYVLGGPCALGAWRMRQKVRRPSNRNSRNLRCSTPFIFSNSTHIDNLNHDSLFLFSPSAFILHSYSGFQSLSPIATIGDCCWE